MQKAAALIPAAGISSRYSKEKNKLLETIGGRTILEHTLRAFDSHPSVSEIIVVLNPSCFDEMDSLVRSFGLTKELKLAKGGSDRQASVRNGLELVEAPLVLIHDAARPAVTEDIITASVEALASRKAALVCVPVTDTVKVADRDMICRETPDRSTLYAAQTPQAFRTEFIRDAHRAAAEAGISVTDDASVAEWAGEEVLIIPGSYNNIKITTQKDMEVLRQIMGQSKVMRTGIGIDTHKLSKVPGERKLILGGVEFDYPYGLIGHSDADVLIHAVMDALLGAAALGDIGQHFPPSDDSYKDIDSMVLLAKVRDVLKDNNCSILNVDAVIIAQKPKMAAFIPQMRDNIASVLGIDVDSVSIKATTTEHLGFEGREEGISSHAVCMIEK